MMRLDISFAARKEFDDAADWYLTMESAELRDRFVYAVNTAIQAAVERQCHSR